MFHYSCQWPCRRCESIQFADVNFVHKVKLTEFIDRFCIGLFVQANNKSGLLLGWLLAYAHRADIDIVPAAQHTDRANHAGLVVIEYDEHGPLRRHLDIEAVDLNYPQQGSAENRAGYSPLNLVGNDLGAKARCDIL